MIIKAIAHYRDGSAKEMNGNPVDLKTISQKNLERLTVRYDDGSEADYGGPARIDFDNIPRENSHTQFMQGAAGSIPPINRNNDGSVVDHSPETAKTKTNLASDDALKDENGYPKPIEHGKDAFGQDIKIGRE